MFRRWRFKIVSLYIIPAEFRWVEKHSAPRRQCKIYLYIYRENGICINTEHCIFKFARDKYYIYTHKNVCLCTIVYTVYLVPRSFGNRCVYLRIYLYLSDRKSFGNNLVRGLHTAAGPYIMYIYMFYRGWIIHINYYHTITTTIATVTVDRLEPNV